MKYFLIIGVVIAIAIAGLFFLPGSEVDYVATVNDEVTALETELAAIEADLKAGTLTPEEAVIAQAKIVTRLSAINQAVESSSKAKLTDAQKQMLSKALTNLYNNLAVYRETLVVVEATAEVEKERTGRSSRGKTTITSILEETQDVVADAVEVIEVDDETIESDITDIIDDIDNASTTDAILEEDVITDNTATSSDEVMENEDTSMSSDEDTEENVTSEETVDDDTEVIDTEEDLIFDTEEETNQ